MDILGANFTLAPLAATFLLGLTAIVLLIWYSLEKQRYWEKIGIPFVKPYLFFGTILENARKPIHEVQYDRYKKFGRLYGHYEGNKALLSVAEPQLLCNILVKDFQAFTRRRRLDTGDKIIESMLTVLQGEDWKRVRAIITPTFTAAKIKKMMGIFKECSRTLVKNFQEISKRRENVDVKSIYGAFTMDIIASSAFSTEIDSHNDPNNEFIAHAKDLLAKSFNWRFFIFVFSPEIMKIFGISFFSQKGTKFFTNATLRIIEERKKTEQKRNDFLQLLMDTAKEVFDEGDLNEKDDIVENYGKQENHQVFKNNCRKESLSRTELVAQCVNFFVAGYETTASTLSFASYLLALNPEVQEKLVEEIDEFLRANDGELTYEAVQSMKYLDNVIAETLRIYSPNVRLERETVEDYKLGDTGLTIPKGMVVTIPVYAMHRDPKHFPDPEKFDPDRFNPEERAKRDQYAYLPFGAGPRNCIGMRFALMEMKVCLAYVLSNFRIKKCSETKVPLEFFNHQVVLQPKDIILSMEVREDTVKAL